MYEDILVPTGPDPSRKRVLDHALELADTYGARIHVLHVSDLVDRSHLGNDEEPTEAGQAVIDDVREAAQAAGVEVEGAIRQGTPYEEILAQVDEVGADLVVMGTHGKQGLTRMLLGSTAEEVVRRSPVPVLTVRD